MVIYDLICDAGHQFEGWFKSANDLAEQQSSRLLSCPMCDSTKVRKKLTAAKLTRKSNATEVIAGTGAGAEGASIDRLTNKALTSVSTKAAGAATSRAGASSGSKTGSIASKDAAAYRKFQKMLSEVHDFVESNFEDVGNRFAEEAISIHRGDKEPANIRGTATAEQLDELAEEGVAAIPLPAKPVDKKKLN